MFLKASLRVTAFLEPLLISHNQDQADLLSKDDVQPKIDQLNTCLDCEIRISLGIIVKEHAWPYLFFMTTRNIFDQVTPSTFAKTT